MLRACLCLAVCLTSGCAGVSGSMATVPPEWRKTNPWSPAAHEARARGELRPLFYTAEMAEHQAFARQHLQDGDILFRHGDSRKLRDRVNDSIQMGCSDSSFNHTAVVCRVGDAVYVYDAEPEPEGVRKLPFEFWILESLPGTLVVKRLRPEYRFAIPRALCYCEQAWRRQPPFDAALNRDDARLYCSEMIEKAFRTAGLALSEPYVIPCLPNWPSYRLWAWLLNFTEIRLDEPLFALGNASYGLYGSPYLETVFGSDSHDRRKPPICPPVPYPAACCPR